MALELVRLVSQWAGIVAILAMVGCFLAATLALELSRAMAETADDAFQLVRRMALVGGGSVIVAGSTSTLYWWRVGVASPRAAVAVGAVVVLAAAAFAVVTHRLFRSR